VGTSRTTLDLVPKPFRTTYSIWKDWVCPVFLLGNLCSISHWVCFILNVLGLLKQTTIQLLAENSQNFIFLVLESRSLKSRAILLPKAVQNYAPLPHLASSALVLWLHIPVCLHRHRTISFYLSLSFFFFYSYMHTMFGSFSPCLVRTLFIGFRAHLSHLWWSQTL
jgi:hypothetical protein